MAVLVSNLQEELAVDAQMEALVEKTAAAALAAAGLVEDAEVSVVFVSDDYIQQLNRQYRDIDSPTDVLSFALEEGEPMPGGGPGRILGDVVISLPRAQEQAQEYGHSLSREVAFLTAHGVLHLLGYDHQDEQGTAGMRALEEAVLTGLGLGR